MTWAILPWRWQPTSKEKSQDCEPEGGPVGTLLAKTSGYNFWELAGPPLARWPQLSAEIRRVLGEQSDPVTCSVVWSAYMVGKNAKTARPTVIFCSKDAASRRAVRDLVRNSRCLRKYPDFVTAERSQPPDFGKLVPLSEAYPCSALELANSSFSDGMVYAATPAGGRATIGGVVQARNVKFYFTVAHIFTGGSYFNQWDGTDDEEDGFDIDEDGDDPADQIVSDDLAEVTSTASASSTLSHGSEERASLSTTSSSPSIRTSHHEQELVGSGGGSEEGGGIDRESVDAAVDVGREATQQTTLSPNLPSDPTTSQAPGGTVSQTSQHKALLPTPGRGEMLDYALIEVPSEESERAKKYVVAKPPARRRPHARRRTTDVVGLTARNAVVPGRMAATPSFLTGRQHHPDGSKGGSGGGVAQQELWTVRLDSPLAGGDCGMWIVDAQSRELYGHVVAGSAADGVAYIVPAYQVFRDIRRRLGGRRGWRPTLPSPPAPLVSSMLHYALRRLLPPEEELRIAIVGPDAGGKTCLLYMLTRGVFPTTTPTIGFNVESVTKGNVNLFIWDVGGGPPIRGLWSHYIGENNDAVIFVADSADRDRMPEAREALHRFVHEVAPLSTPLLVLGNKSDMHGALSVQQLSEALELRALGGREVACYSVSAMRGTNLDLVVRWLVTRIIGKARR